MTPTPGTPAPSEEAPKLSEAERAILLRRHYPVWYEYNDQEEPIQLATPRCEGCGEDWKDGCPTTRTLRTLRWAERERDEAQETARKSIQALGDIGTLAVWRYAHDKRTLEIKVQVADEALWAGGIGVMDSVLLQVRKEILAMIPEAITQTASAMVATPPAVRNGG